MNETNQVKRTKRQRPCPRCGGECSVAALLCFPCFRLAPAELRRGFMNLGDLPARRAAARGVLQWAQQNPAQKGPQS